jgi:uncharacterized membrane protein (DUF4010 family)
VSVLTTDVLEILGRLGVALAIGLLIGFERGWKERDLPEGRRIAGFRTFGVLGILGGGGAILAESYGGLVLAAVILAVAGVFAVAQWFEFRDASGADLSITTSIAALTTLALGSLAGSGYLAAAGSAAVVLALLLGFKPEMHAFLKKVNRPELLATLRLLLISLVALPILPDQGYGPWQALNPYKLWLLVVLVAGISYVGYFAGKIVGDRRGIMLTGLLGGLVSSTATTLALARQSRSRPTESVLLAAGILFSLAMMLPRTLLIAAVILPGALKTLSLPLLLSACAALGFAFLFNRKRGAGAELAEHTDQQRNPLELGAAFQLAGIMGVFILAAQAIREWYGQTGLYGIAVLLGLVDIDAVTVSIGTMAGRGDVEGAIAVNALLIALATNTLVKPALAVVAGSQRTALYVTGAVVGVLAVLAATFFGQHTVAVLGLAV